MELQEQRHRFWQGPTFEITVPTIAKAALEGQIETLRGVTENVIVGATVPVGTGMVDLYMKVKEQNAEDN